MASSVSPLNCVYSPDCVAEYGDNSATCDDGPLGGGGCVCNGVACSLIFGLNYQGVVIGAVSIALFIVVVLFSYAAIARRRRRLRRLAARRKAYGMGDGSGNETAVVAWDGETDDVKSYIIDGFGDSSTKKIGSGSCIFFFFSFFICVCVASRERVGEYRGLRSHSRAREQVPLRTCTK
jgi:hypothetical protein